MADSRPNHFISIPRSVVSLKHYFEIHDQPLSRSLIYLAILGALIMALTTLVTVIRIRAADGPLAAELAEHLEPVTFADGKASVEGQQPRVLWEKTTEVPIPPAEEGDEPKTVQLRSLTIVVDTTGKLEDIDQAYLFVGCVYPKRFLFFGTNRIESHQEPASQGEKAVAETYEYADAEKVAELKAFIEKAGGTMPELTVEDGKAKFGLEPDKLHRLVHTRDVMVLVDATGKDRNMEQAIGRDPELHSRLAQPEFLALVRESEMLVRFGDAKEVSRLPFEAAGPLDAGKLAAWLAAQASATRTSGTLRVFLPRLVETVMILFIASLLVAVAGSLASGMAKAGLVYSECLNMAIYATTPAFVGLLFLLMAVYPLGMAYLLKGGMGYLLLAVVIGKQAPLLGVLLATLGIAATYTILGVQRVARAVQPDDTPDI